MTMHQVAILEAEVKELRAANAKQKQKREKHCTYISQGEGLTIKEGMNRVQSHDEKKRGVVEQPDSQPQKRAAPQCSGCGTIGHTIRTCSQGIRSNS